jgi:hypothetical protein
MSMSSTSRLPKYVDTSSGLSEGRILVQSPISMTSLIR